MDFITLEEETDKNRDKQSRHFMVSILFSHNKSSAK